MSPILPRHAVISSYFYENYVVAIEKSRDVENRAYIVTNEDLPYTVDGVPFEAFTRLRGFMVVESSPVLALNTALMRDVVVEPFRPTIRVITKQLDLAWEKETERSYPVNMTFDAFAEAAMEFTARPKQPLRWGDEDVHSIFEELEHTLVHPFGISADYVVWTDRGGETQIKVRELQRPGGPA